MSLTPTTTSTPDSNQPSTTKASTSTSSIMTSDNDLEKLLNREASALQRELEVERILKAFKLNPYDILDIDETATQEDIKRKYRQLSLFIHPDKTNHERAPEAFDLLKKAESDLNDKTKREELDAIIQQSRILVLKSLSLSTSTPDDDHRLKGIDPPFKTRLRQQSKDLLIEEELRRRKAIKMNLANEGLEARRKDEEVVAKKRKAEEDKQWEDTREQRVDSWRNFANTKKKKKTKVSVLG